MATFTFASNNYYGRYLQLTITETIEATTNTSILNWTFSSIGGSSDFYSIAPTKIAIYGITVYEKDATGWTSGEFPAATGSVSGTFRVPHDYDGTRKNVPIVFDTRVYYSTAAAYGGTIDLTPIDMIAPTVTLTTANVTESSVAITAESDFTADIWEYTLDYGTTWVNFFDLPAALVGTTIIELSPNTEYNLQVRVRRQYNHVYGYSPYVTIKTLGNSLINSVNDLSIDLATPVLTMNWTVYVASYKHTLTVKDGSTNVLTMTGLTCTLGTNNKTVTLSPEQRTTILKYMKNKASFVATFELTTYDGNTQIGSTTSNTATILTTAKVSAPTVSDFTHRDSDVHIVNDITFDDNIYIKGHSLLHIEIGETSAKNEAVVSSYRVTIGSDSKLFYDPIIDYGKIDVYGDNIPLVVEVIDSRGHSTAITKNIHVVDYSPISITKYAIRRKNEVEPTAQLSFSGDISQIKIDGEIRNKVTTALITYIPLGGNISDPVNLTVEESPGKFEFSTLALSNENGIIQFDQNLSYHINISISDQLSDDSMTVFLNKGIPLMAFRQKKVGINTPDPQAAMHIRGDGDLLRLNDLTIQELMVQTIYPVGSIYMSINATPPSVLFGGVWEQIQNRFLLAASESHPVGETGGSEEHKHGKGDLVAAIGAGNSEPHSISYVVDNTHGGQISTYLVRGNGYTEGMVMNHNTAIIGETSVTTSMPPYISVYMWQRVE